MTKSKNRSNQGTLLKWVAGSLAAVGVLLLVLTIGNDVVLYNPKGLIAQEQFRLMMFSTGVLLAIAIPVLSLLYGFAWKYRETNKKVSHKPQKPHGKFFAVSLWIVPIIILLILSSVVWPATHKLDPHKPLAATSNNRPLTIQVIALQWKWLFIYPEQDIATVNFVQIPEDTPVTFELTADEAPMNSFWIPHLGGQLYAMTGHSNPLNLMADTPGDYPGQAAEINGEGFAGMKFTARVSTDAAFKDWVRETKRNAGRLDADTYKMLVAPSGHNPVMVYSSVESNLYNKVLMKYGGSHQGHDQPMGHEGH